jgi:hypothetical protein
MSTQTAPKLMRYVLSVANDGPSPTGFGKGDAPTMLRKIASLFGAAAQGAHASNLKMAYNAVAAQATITVGGTGTNGDTLVVLGTTITMKTSGASAAANEINIGGSVTAVANQIVGLINGTTSGSPNSWAGMCSASNVAGVITLTCLIPGVIGNVLLATTRSSTALTITHDFGTSVAGSEGTAATFKSGIA